MTQNYQPILYREHPGGAKAIGGGREQRRVCCFVSTPEPSAATHNSTSLYMMAGDHGIKAFVRLFRPVSLLPTVPERCTKLVKALAQAERGAIEIPSPEKKPCSGNYLTIETLLITLLTSVSARLGIFHFCYTFSSPLAQTLPRSRPPQGLACHDSVTLRDGQLLMDE
jgi:hypothetical protein